MTEAMTESLFAVYDNKVESAITIFTARNTNDGMRSFGDQVNKKNPQTGEYVLVFARHPEDYGLYEIGTWVPDEMKVVMHEAPKGLGLALEYLEKE